MGVDPKWGPFPLCPEMSHLVCVCPFLSGLSPVWAPSTTREDKRGQHRTFWGKWETSPFRIYRQLALLKLGPSQFKSHMMFLMFLDIACVDCTGKVQKHNVTTVIQERKRGGINRKARTPQKSSRKMFGQTQIR